MYPMLAFLVVALFSAVASAEEWSRIPSGDALLAIEYKKSSIQTVPPSARKATTRFVSMTGENLPGINVYSVVSEVEYNCRQPLQKIISARILAADGTVTSEQQVESAVYSEIPPGSNMFRLWMEICLTGHAKQR